MKLFFHILIFGSIVLAIFSCSEDKAPKNNGYFESVEDSLDVIYNIRDSLFTELYIQNGVENYIQHNYCLPPDLVSLRSFFNIEIDDSNRTNVRRRHDNIPLDSVKDCIVDFYLKNSQENDIGNFFPIYKTYTRQENQSNISLYSTKIKTSLNEESVRIYKEQLSDLKSFSDVFSILESDSLRIIDANTRITLWYSTKSTIENAVIDTILFAYVNLKNQTAEHYFHESYAQIFDRNLRSPNNLDQQKLNAIDFILPVNLHIMNWISDEEKFKADFENENSQITKRILSFTQKPID